MDRGTFDAGRFIDGADGIDTSGLRLFGTPEGRAAAFFERIDEGGACTARCDFDSAAGTFLAMVRATEAIPLLLDAAHDLAGNAVVLAGDVAMRWRPGVGLGDERTNPFTVMAKTTRVVSRLGRILVAGVRVEQRGSESYEFLRMTEYR